MALRRDGKLVYDDERLPLAERESLVPHFRDAAESDARVQEYGFLVYPLDPDTVDLEVKVGGQWRRRRFSSAELLVSRTVTGAEMLRELVEQ